MATGPTRSVICQNCHAIFPAPTHNLKKGWGKYCSLSCSHEAKINRPSLQQILARCEARGDCLEWLGDRYPYGYGRISYGGKTTSLHRLVFMLANGVTLTSSDVVRHSCDNPPCCNPAHLLVGSCADNNADKIIRERQAKGSGCGQAVLTEAMIPGIRAALAAKEPTLAIAKRLGVSRGAIRRIADGSGWRHV